ncbi:MAG: hypothetical protein LBG52_05645 [Candidatus Peribacteria bacterium]|jgi:hypothetical protein|nr:hypothetical protein [Candidatus Peribacteria bacterium]
MVEICNKLYPASKFWRQDYKNPINERKYQLIVSNPPYEDLTAFFEYLYETLLPEGVAVLLLPSGFIDKQRPKNLVKVLNNFAILERRPMEEEFERTGIKAEIIALRVIK